MRRPRQGAGLREMSRTERSAITISLVFLLMLPVTATPGAVPAESPRYEIEFLDRDAIEAPSEALPLGGTLVSGGLAISTSGRYVAGEVRDDRDGTSVAYRLDRLHGTVEHILALRGFSVVPQVNDSGHLVGKRFVDGAFEVVFWSEETGVVSFGSPSVPAYSVRSLAYNRYFNNGDDVLVRPQPFDRGPNGAILWNPVLGSEVPLPFGSMALNDEGVVVGQVETANGLRAFAWDLADGLVALPGPDGERQAAFGIDGAGRIVGESDPDSGPTYGLLWTERGADPVAMPCPDDPDAPALHECAALHLDGSGDVFGGANFDDGEPLVPLVWVNGDPFPLNDLLLDPNARCGYSQVSDLGELAGLCGVFDPDLPEGSPPVVSGPAILRLVSPGVLDCSNAVASPSALWPPDHELRPVRIVGIETDDGSDPTIVVTGVSQDEPTDGTGDGDTAPDAVLDDAGDVAVRQERSGLGDGRIYEIEFEATSGSASCAGSVIVGVPHDQRRGSVPVDSGSRYDSMS